MVGWWLGCDVLCDVLRTWKLDKRNTLEDTILSHYWIRRSESSILQSLVVDLSVVHSPRISWHSLKRTYNWVKLMYCLMWNKSQLVHHAVTTVRQTQIPLNLFINSYTYIQNQCAQNKALSGTSQKSKRRVRKSDCGPLRLVCFAYIPPRGIFRHFEFANKRYKYSIKVSEICWPAFKNHVHVFQISFLDGSANLVKNE